MIILDAIIQWLDRASESNRDDQVVPAVILWLDNDRWYAEILREKLTRPYVHLIFGARQTGKSTLLRALLPSESARAEWTTIRAPLD